MSLPGEHEFHTVDSRDVYSGAIVALRVDRVAMPGGREADREVVEHHGAVAVAVLDDHLMTRAWLVGDGPTIADVSVYAYAHVAPDAGLEVPPAAAAWMRRIRGLDGFVDDLVLYAENACPTVSRSIYD